MASTTRQTEVSLIFGDTVIPAVLNDSQSSKELIARLPVTVKLQKYEHDFCGVMREPLSYDKADLHNGWHNGEIAFAADGNYFTILFSGQEVSQQYGNLVTLGKIEGSLSVMDTLDRNISVRIELKSE